MIGEREPQVRLADPGGAVDDRERAGQEPAAEHRIETAEEREASRRAARAQNFGFEKVIRLPGNIGLLELNSFQDPEFAGETAGAVMTFLATSDALIIDLRTSRGGGAMRGSRVFS